MAATSSWGLGTHKISTGIPSPTLVSSQPAESPSKAKSYSMEGQRYESRASPSTSSAAAALPRHGSSLNGTGTSSMPVKGSMEEASEAAATSSDSGGDDEDEVREGVPNARKMVRTEAREVEPTQANGHHGDLNSMLPARVEGGNGHAATGAGEPEGRAKVDEQASRASDAAKAAVAAALASATKLPQSQPPVRSESLMFPKKNKCSTAALEAGDGENGPMNEGQREHAFSSLMKFRVPLGMSLPERVRATDVSRAFDAVDFMWEDHKSAPMIRDGSSRALPAPIVFPLAPMPCMVGRFSIDRSADVHRCVGTWAMTKADLEAAAKVESRASPFEFWIPADPDSFPCSGNYTGHFLVRQSPKPVTKVDENDLHLAFEKNSGGTWNVEGHGRNIYGSFTITGRLDADRRLEVYRAYTKTPARGHRRPSVSSPAASAAATTTSLARGGGASVTSAGNGSVGGKRPYSHPAPRGHSATPSVLANGVATASADDGSSLPPAPTARRVKRTPSYLIKDIGNDDNTHLSNGLRRCVTLLKALMNVRGKSEWFEKPVDHVGLNLYDYLTIIKRPMDLGTVRHKLEGGEYQNTGEFAADVRLVFSNARLYNSDPNSLVHVAARELFEMFESKFAALGSNLDEPSLKRKKSSGGSGGGSSGGSTSSNAAACADDTERSSAKGNRGKRKSSGGGKAGVEGGQGTGNGGSKKARVTPATKGVPSPPAFSATPQAAAAPKPKPPVTPSGGIESSSPTDPESQILLMQRKMAEMQEQLQRMQRQQAEVAAAAAASAGVSTPQPETLQKQPSSGSKRKSKGGSSKSGAASKSGEGSKSGGKKGSSKGGSKKGASSKAGTSSEKAAAGKSAKSSKAASKASAKAAAAAEAQAAAAEAAVPLTFGEKKALSDAINELDQNNLTRVVEIIQARMPLGSSEEEIELDIDSMDSLTLRDLQSYIRELSERGGSIRNGGTASDSESDSW